MPNSEMANNLGALLKTTVTDPRAVLASQLHQSGFFRGVAAAKDWPAAPASEGGEAWESSNALSEYFEAHEEGLGIFKWLHYFEIYHRHLAKFIGKEVHVLEIGVYSGGSLEMWHSYLGPGSRITGVDILPDCKRYENEYTKIALGDQADRSFWKRFRDEYPPVDIVIDDGGHQSEQQIITLEETVPHLRPGGVYICEDVLGLRRNFVSFVGGLDAAFNAVQVDPDPPAGVQMAFRTTPFQSQIHSIHHYPLVVVVEKHDRPKTHLLSVRRGSDWQAPAK